MENEKNESLNPAQPDVYALEEQCQKSIKAVSKAIIMRLLVAVIMAWAVFSFSMEPWVWGLMALVMLMDLSGLIPLGMELKKQRRRLKELIASEEE